MQGSCTLVGDVEEGRSSWTLQVPPSVEPHSRHFDPIFSMDDLWLPPHFESFFKSGWWWPGRWPPHPNMEGRL